MKWILSFLLLPALCFAEENRGVSWILQMCSEHADCSVVDSAYKDANKLNAGWMVLTSNPNRCKCAPKFLSDLRPKRVRVTICNSTCFPERGRQCQPHECFAGQNSKTASAAVLSNEPRTYRRIDKAIAIAKNDLRGARGVLELGIAPCLECTLTREARLKLNRYVWDKFSDIPHVAVDNPYGDSCLPGVICEKHGSPQGGPQIISDNDGLDYDGIDQWKYWQKNESSFLTLAWKGCNNGLKKCEKPPCSFIPPQNRKDYCGRSRDGVDFSSATAPNAVAVQSPVNDADKKGCKRFHDAPDGLKNFVLKLGDGRNYGVWLSPEKLSKASFKKVQLRKGGRVVDESKPGDPRYRFGAVYGHDPAGHRRRVYDFRKHPNSYPDNSVLFADGNCWVLKKPRFRVD